MKVADNDWVGAWFKVFEELEPVSFDISVYKINDKSGKIEVCLTEHSKMDGTKAVTSALIRDGVAPDYIRFHRHKKKHLSPSVFAKLKGMILHIFFVLKSSAPVWLNNLSTHEIRSADKDFLFDVMENLNAIKEFGDGVNYYITPDTGIAVFSEEATKNLFAKAKSLRVSLNSMLLHGIEQTIPHLFVVPTDKKHVWMIPVDMREYLTKDVNNAAAYFAVELNESLVCGQVHRKIKNLFKRNYHWGSWWFLNCGRYFGVNFMKLIGRLQVKYKISILGSFSNLGKLSVEGIDSAEAWFFSQPISKHVPIACSALECNGTLVIGVKLHSSVNIEPDYARQCIQSWSKFLLLKRLETNSKHV